MELDNQELEATKNREKTADEMFEELRYVKEENDNFITYYQPTDKQRRFYNLMFYKRAKSIHINKKWNNITMEELQAINKKVGELRLEVKNIIKIDKNLILERQARCKEDIKYYERKYRYAKENNDGFYMKSHWRTINRLQAEFETLGWILSCEIKD